MGMYITWEVASGQTETIAATDELTMNYVMNLYSLNLNTNGNNYTNGAVGTLVSDTSPYYFFFYTSWLMASGDYATTGGPNGSALPYDAMIARLQIETAEGTPDTIDVQTNDITDYHCADAACATQEVDDTESTTFEWGTNTPGTSGLCSELWTVTVGDTDTTNQENASICTKIEVVTKRKLANVGADGPSETDTAVEDADLSFRKYSVAAGWRAGCLNTDDFTCARISGLSTNADNLIYDFTAQTVDYYDGFFVEASLYTGAMSKISFAAAIIASSAALLTF